MSNGMVVGFAVLNVHWFEVQGLGWRRQRINRLLKRHIHCCRSVSDQVVLAVSQECIHNTTHVVVLELSCQVVVEALRFEIVVERKGSVEEIIIFRP